MLNLSVPKTVIVMKLLFVLIITSSAASQSYYVTFNISSSSSMPEVGDIFTTTLQFTTHGAVLGSYDIRANYDPTLLKIIQVTVPTESEFHDNTFVDQNSFTSGSTAIGAFQTENTSVRDTPTDFAQIQWEVLSPPTSRDAIMLDPITVIDANWRPINVYHTGVTLTGDTVYPKGNLPAVITLNKCTVKANRQKDQPPADSIQISVSPFLATDTDFAPSNTIKIVVFNEDGESFVFFEEIKVSEGNFRDGKFLYKSKEGAIKSLNINLHKDSFSITSNETNLSGLTSPLIVEIEVGDYLCVGLADETVINDSKKSIPMQLLSGYKDSLRVDKCKFKLGTNKPGTDYLMVQGAIAVEDTSVNIASEDVLVSWGDYEITLPANDLYQIGLRKAFKYKKPKGTDSSIAAAIFDLEKCTFKLIIKNANIDSQDNPVDFAIQFDNFNETIDLQLTEKNANLFVYP